MSKYDKIQWVIQRNLTSEDVTADLRKACQKIKVDCHPIDIIPFSNSLPEFPKDKRTIFYGSTTTMYLVYQDNNYNEGLFFNEQTFSIENYLDKWKENMLNFGAKVMTVGQLSALNYENDKLLFIRPDADSKSFSGEVKRFDEIDNWFERVKTFEDMDITKDTKIIIAEPYHITSEWRLWIVNGKVVTASKYRENFKLKKENGCPQNVIEFAELRCKEYKLHDVFVMDIGLCGDTLYIIECGCMNSAGFYNADIDKIVSSVTEYFYHISG
jgi:ATP-grasp domain, R2K clade family 3